MARGMVKIICKKCGEEFKKVRFFNKRAEADAWEAWVVENITICPDCYHIGDGEVVEMKYAEYKAKYSHLRTLSDSYNKKTKTIKVIMPAKKHNITAEATKSEIFAEAHRIARGLRDGGMDYKSAFSRALKEVYAAVRAAKSAQAKAA